MVAPCTDIAEVHRAYTLTKEHTVQTLNIDALSAYTPFMLRGNDGVEWLVEIFVAIERTGERYSTF